jgi:hypothetical protein
MRCQSCKAEKERLIPVESKALPGVNLLICSTCKKQGFEPRHILVLAARSGYSVRDWIVKRRYHGKSLSAEEITV